MKNPLETISHAELQELIDTQPNNPMLWFYWQELIRRNNETHRLCRFDKFNYLIP